MRIPPLSRHPRPGFTLIEIMIGTLIMSVLVAGVLSVFVKTNKTSVDQQQVVNLQGDVRAGLYYVSRDVRMAGSGLSGLALSSFVQGIDAENQGAEVRPDRIRLLGNLEEPLNLSILEYQGSAATVTVGDYSLEINPYPDAWYDNKIVLVLPNPASACRGAAVREISQVIHSSGGTNEGFNFSPGQAPGINPPGGLSDVCADTDYAGGSIIMINVRDYWLDVTGAYPGLTAGVDGYIGGGVGGVLYMTDNAKHFPIAQNIENFQVQYNGNFDGDAADTLDGFQDWQTTWNLDQIGRIREVRVWIVGRTPERMTSVTMRTADPAALYRRPTIANSAGAALDDWHKRFILQTTAQVRNMSLNLYNRGVRS